MEFELLAGLGEPARRALLATMPRRSFRKDEVLFHEGDPGDTLHLIEKGRVAIRPSTPDGDVVTLTVLGPGASFGEQALLTADARRTASVVALERVETRTLHRNDLAQLRAAEPSIDRFLVDLLAGQVRRLSAQVIECLYLPADRRVMRRLVQVAELFDTGERPIDVDLRQDDIASMAGTTRPTANRVLRQLVAEGLIELRRGHLAIRDVEAIRRKAR